MEKELAKIRSLPLEKRATALKDLRRKVLEFSRNTALLQEIDRLLRSTEREIIVTREIAKVTNKGESLDKKIDDEEKKKDKDQDLDKLAKEAEETKKTNLDDDIRDAYKQTTPEAVYQADKNVYQADTPYTSDSTFKEEASRPYDESTGQANRPYQEQGNEVYQRDQKGSAFGEKKNSWEKEDKYLQ
jgi:hypothetical protein